MFVKVKVSNVYLLKCDVHVSVETGEDPSIVDAGVELDNDRTAQQVLEEG